MKLLFLFGFACGSHISKAGNEAGVAVTLQGDAPAVCNFSSSLRSRSAQNMELASGAPRGVTVAISHMLDEKTGRLQPATIGLLIRGVCNVPHQLKLQSARGALVPDTQPTEIAGAFLKEVGYRAVAQWGDQTITLIASDSTRQPQVTQDIPSARVGDLALEIAVTGAENDLATPVLSGIYSDTVTIFIGARP